jgi:hypothetical protein
VIAALLVIVGPTALIDVLIILVIVPWKLWMNKHQIKLTQTTQKASAERLAKTAEIVERGSESSRCTAGKRPTSEGSLTSEKRYCFDDLRPEEKLLRLPGLRRATWKNFKEPKDPTGASEAIELREVLLRPGLH